MFAQPDPNSIARSLKQSAEHSQRCKSDPFRPLEWLLLTTEAVRTREDALNILWTYSRRWRIEDFHKAWKSGTRVEELRPRSANNLERGVIIRRDMESRRRRV